MLKVTLENDYQHRSDRDALAESLRLEAEHNLKMAAENQKPAKPDAEIAGLSASLEATKIDDSDLLAGKKEKEKEKESKDEENKEKENKDQKKKGEEKADKQDVYNEEEDLVERRAAMECFLAPHNDEIKSCNFPPAEEKDYILRFFQVTEVVVRKMETEASGCLAHLWSTNPAFPVLSRKIDEMREEACDHPERVDEAFQKRQDEASKEYNALTYNFGGDDGFISKESVEEKMGKHTDIRKKSFVAEIVEPVVKAAKARNGKVRTERVKWNEINAMVDIAQSMIGASVWWDDVLGGIPDWYKPIWYKNGFLR